VVEFPSGGVSVQRDTGRQTVGEDLIPLSIPTPINTSRTFPIFTASNSGTGNAFPRGRYYSEILDESSAQFICGYDGNTVDYAWQIVDTSGFVTDKYNFAQNDFEFFETNNSVTLTNNWPPGYGDNLLENEAMTQIPATNETLAYGDKTRLQMNMTISGITFPSTSTGFILQYRETEDCTTYGYWTDVGDKGSGSIWRLYDEAAIGDSTTQVNDISTSDSSAEGYYSEINPSANNPNDVLVGENTEWDWPIENNGAADNTTYCFRMVLDDYRVLGSYQSDSFPKITTAPGVGDLMRHGKFFQNETFKGYFWAD